MEGSGWGKEEYLPCMWPRAAMKLPSEVMGYGADLISPAVPLGGLKDCNAFPHSDRLVNNCLARKVW